MSNQWDNKRVLVACACMCVRACVCAQSCLTVTPWTVACEASLSMEFFRQEYWSGLPFSTPWNLPDPGIEPVSCASCIGRWILYHRATWATKEANKQYGKTVLLKLRNHPVIWLQGRSWFRDLSLALRFCISNKHPDDADTSPGPVWVTSIPRYFPSLMRGVTWGVLLKILLPRFLPWRLSFNRFVMGPRLLIFNKYLKVSLIVRKVWESLL